SISSPIAPVAPTASTFPISDPSPFVKPIATEPTPISPYPPANNLVSSSSIPPSVDLSPI
ncbi:hypothetical protein U1Q18_010042, partial [Sarracenia purpurea var. burkii]